MKILTSEILQSAPNDTKLNSVNQTQKVFYICIANDREAQIFILFAILSAVFNILYILEFSH